MSHRFTHAVGLSAVTAVAALAGVTPALAPTHHHHRSHARRQTTDASSTSRNGETPLTGSTLTSAENAAIAANPGATANSASTETDSSLSGAAYEVHITKADGSHAVVIENSSFTVLATEAGSDEELARLSAAGVDAAFDMLAARHRPALVRRCAKLVGQTDAEEATQEALIRAYLALARRERVHAVGPWLRTIAHNTSLNLLRARTIRPTAGEDERERPWLETDTLERREPLRLVVQALASLPERQREAIVMREIEGRSYAEIQARLNASNGAVRQLPHRARITLRNRVAHVAASGRRAGC